MDFKAALQAEIETKRKLLAKAARDKPSDSSQETNEGDTKTTSVRIADLEQQRQEDYHARQRVIDEQRQAKLQKKLARFEKELPDANARSEEAASTEEQIDESVNREVERKLKTRGHPIRLFGESDRQRMARLRLLELREEELGGGQRNDFYELLERQETGEGGKRSKIDDDDKAQKQAIALEEDDAIRARTILDIEPLDRRMLATDRNRTRALLGLFVKTLLQQWQDELDARPEEVKRSTAGKVALATHQQAEDYLKPFFRMLRRDELAADILAHLIDIVSFLQNREYVRANDTYLRLSIGNAPWPIGVTMVGIHERSAHEKITTGSVAHVLNDEISRKWIQSIKRLMTFCQRVYPPSDPSKAMG